MSPFSVEDPLDPIARPGADDEVYEFTDTGILVPWQEALNYDCFRPASSLGCALAGDQTVAEIFTSSAGRTILARVTALDVPVWIVCRTRTAFLRFTRDWLTRLAELNRGDQLGHLEEILSDFLDEAASLIGERRGLPSLPSKNSS
jgi:hypothetical protein